MPPAPRYYLPPVPSPPATQSSATTTSYTPNKNMPNGQQSYMPSGQQNQTNHAHAVQRSPQQPKPESFKTASNNNYSMYQPQVSKTLNAAVNRRFQLWLGFNHVTFKH